jgi:predicted MFS family arabinose efflux permease
MSEALRVAQPARDPWPLVIGATAAQLIGGLITITLPFAVGGLMAGIPLSERDAGFVTSVELLALAITAIAIVPLLARFSFRTVTVAAVVVMLLAQGASVFAVSLTLITMLRGIAGIGEGALYAVSLSVIAARSINPDKVYGYFQVAWALGSVPIFAFGGELTTAFAQRGIFALMEIATLALAPLLLLLPGDRVSRGTDSAAEEPRTSPMLGILTLAAIGLYLVVSAGVYAFTTQLGERAGVGTDAVGYTLTVGTLIGVAGAAAATALNVRWGRMIPISGFFIAFTLDVLALCLWRDPIAFTVALIVATIIFYFSVPYMFGLAAALDRSGRWAAAAGSAYLLGYAAGPAAGGIVIAASGYAGLAVASVIVTAVAWALTVIVCRRLDAAARPVIAVEG